MRVRHGKREDISEMNKLRSIFWKRNRSQSLVVHQLNETVPAQIEIDTTEEVSFFTHKE